MESRHLQAPVATLQQRGAAASPGRKQKAAAGGDEKNRRALGDIGNRVNFRDVDGQASKRHFSSRIVLREQIHFNPIASDSSFQSSFFFLPDSRKVQPQISLPVARFAAQVLENAQPAEPDKAYIFPFKPAFVAVNVRGKEGAKAAKQKAAVKPKTEEVIEISSGDERAKAAEQKISVNLKTEEVIEVSSGNGDRRTSRRKVHTLTSVLTARSKVACEVVHKPNNLAHNIDELDADDELAVVDYVEDIYSFYRFAERYSRPRDYMGSQVEINAKMRSILADWLIEVHRNGNCSEEELQLVGLSSMLVACKYEEIWAPKVNDFIYISDRAYGRKQILATEKAILNKLEWNLTVPTPYVFLVRFLKAAMSDKEVNGEHGIFLRGVGFDALFDGRQASPVHARCLGSLRRTVDAGEEARWTETLERHTGYDELQLGDCAQHLLSFHASAAESKLRAVCNKYSSSRRGAVALRSPPTKLL
ncbi:Cyclin, C-terminal domain [Musa troglodytarum]|uniref:Cyclin, C-terminal domain n=1 Tax=Musa troglodytarum TaxID=320322 RepID=A0A9E7JAI3_9LILI|nr:Cyclin, C-terminal domain [Musa troglodytarum]